MDGKFLAGTPDILQSFNQTITIIVVIIIIIVI